jgi:hypothetical protein
VRAFGYEADPSADDSEDVRLLNLREATLSCSFDDMRRIARFVNEVVAMIDSGDVEPRPGWHMHFQDLDADWTEDEADFILAWNADQS